MSLAPIGIVTYSRIDHLTQTVDSLKSNDLAKESELYIFLDAPRMGDEDKVRIVRDYIHTIDGFKNVHIIEREKNDLYANYKLGIKQMLDEHGRCIFLEDDNVVSSAFLNYMNDGLDFYNENKKIMAISGYNVPTIFPNSYKHDYYLSTYFNAWGFATWADRGFLDIVSYNDQYNEMMANKDLFKKIKKIHPNLINGLKLIQEGKLDAGDYKMVFHLIKNDLLTIKPIKSLVNNIGHDGSGVHCGVNDRFQNVELNSTKIKFSNNVEYTKFIDEIYYKYVIKKSNIFKRIINKVFK
ncbi:MAG: glycosyltransferase [Sulfuricurvum sp.]|nr:glycosyltransferase [Sulfuricurvum sp.]